MKPGRPPNERELKAIIEVGQVDYDYCVQLVILERWWHQMLLKWDDWKLLRTIKLSRVIPHFERACDELERLTGRRAGCTLDEGQIRTFANRMKLEIRELDPNYVDSSRGFDRHYDTLR